MGRVNRVRSALAGFGAGLPPTFWWLWLGTLANALATYVFCFLALFLTARGFDVEAAGRVVAAFGGGSIVAAPLSGFFADRFGRRPTLLVSLLATAAVTALLPALRSPLALGADVFALGVVSTAFRPPLNAMVADVVPPPERPRAFGLVYWAVNVGMAVSLVVGGALAAYGYERLFLVDAATTLVFALLVWSKVPETHPLAGEEGAASISDGHGYAEVLADRTFMAFVAVNFVFIVVFWQFHVTAAIDMAGHGLGPAQFGRVLAVNGLLIATLQPLSARRVRSFDAAHVLAVASVLVGLGYGAYALCESALHYAAATAVWSVGEILALPVASALVADLSPTALRGRYQGAFALSFGLGILAAPVLGSLVLQRAGSAALWTSCLGLGLAVAAAHLAIAPPRRRRLAARPAEQVA